MKDLEKQFIQAYDELADAIFRHCYFRVFNRERAKEIVQDTFMRTWEYLKNSQVANLKAFLYKVANNLIIDESRKKKPVSLENLQEGGFDPPDGSKEKLLNFMESSDAVKILNQINPKYRQAIQMRFIDDLSPKEIAEAIGETENNISVRIYRGLEQIRKSFDE